MPAITTRGALSWLGFQSSLSKKTAPAFVAYSSIGNPGQNNVNNLSWGTITAANGAVYSNTVLGLTLSPASSTLPGDLLIAVVSLAPTSWSLTGTATQPWGMKNGWASPYGWTLLGYEAVWSQDTPAVAVFSHRVTSDSSGRLDSASTATFPLMGATTAQVVMLTLRGAAIDAIGSIVNGSSQGSPVSVPGISVAANSSTVLCINQFWGLAIYAASAYVPPTGFSTVASTSVYPYLDNTSGNTFVAAKTLNAGNTGNLTQSPPYSAMQWPYGPYVSTLLSLSPA